MRSSFFNYQLNYSRLYHDEKNKRKTCFCTPQSPLAWRQIETNKKSIFFWRRDGSFYSRRTFVFLQHYYRMATPISRSIKRERERERERERDRKSLNKPIYQSYTLGIPCYWLLYSISTNSLTSYRPLFSIVSVFI